MTIAAELLPGTLVDRRYRIQRVLGRGGFGRTYLVVDKWRFGELCVLKEFAPSNRGDAVVTQKLRELFQREATILHKLNHPQIPKFLAVFEENSRLFIVQEYVNGKTYWNLLREKHQNGTTFTETEILQWLKDLLRVLAYLHQQNIVHRDISPDNVMLARGKKLPILIDFGAVKQAATHLNQSHTPADGLIQASVSVGKSGYAPYEQLRLGQCSPRSDLYAVAVTAVVLLTAKPPSQLIDPNSLEWKWQTLVKLDPVLIRILEKMMAEKPKDRYASAKTILKDLQQVHPNAEAQSERISKNLSGWVQADTHVQSQHLGLLPSRPAQTTRSQKSSAVNRSKISRKPKLFPSHPNVFKVSKAPKVMVGKIGTSEEKFFLTWSKLLIGGCLALLPLGGILIGVQSSYISAVCQTLDNCANNQQAELLYQQSVRQATTAQTLSEMAKNLPDLKLAHHQLSAAVAQLSGLANDSKLAPIVQQRLALDRGHLDYLESRLEKESKAAELLSRAKAEAQKATELTTIAQKTQDYETARRQWAKALATLQAVRPSTFAQNQVTARSQEYTARLETLDLRIAALKPQVIAQTPANPFQPLVNEPLIEPTVAPRRIAQPPLISPPEQIVYAQTAAIPRTAPTRAIAPRTVALPERSQRRTTQRSAPVQLAQAPSASRPPQVTRPPAIASSQPTRLQPTRLVATAPPPTLSPDIAPQTLSQQTLNNVSIQLDDARVSPNGTVAANLVVENHSDRTFGFVPLFAEVEDANGNVVRSRVHFTNREDGVAEPGEVLYGQVHMFNREWNSSGSQNLALVIQEGTTGNRNFRLVF
ncbi:MAG: protein kinase [Timaviella obliquedivisa GSE-PSE-MK23-08B]|nr:protein kinase [Timaviella obliquedivisa GSE-PSE-MK23-08B]